MVGFESNMAGIPKRKGEDTDAKTTTTKPLAD